ncbi:MAG TPA: S-layer homology domain-containing protein [Clostridia bacterium]|nr:S-layer homology domain-containing protein [Clostridia bacterium]
MHLNKKTISYVLTAALVFNSLMIPTFSADIQYTGITSGDALISNATYTDIGSNSNAENIMKMSIYSIIREYGIKTFRPSQNASRQDFLAALVRATGQQEAAVKRGEALKIQDPSLNSTTAYILGHIELARSSGIIKPGEYDNAATITAADRAAAKAEADKAKRANWKMTKAQYDQIINRKLEQMAFTAPANREEAALWIARALGLQPVKGEEMAEVYSYNDWRSIKTENLPYIDAVLKMGISTAASKGAYSPKNSMTRSEMASVLNLVANQTLDKLGFETGKGKVTSVKVKRDLGSLSDSAVTDITIDSTGADIINISIEKNTGRNINSRQALPVIKNGKVGDEALITEGDVVEYTVNKDNGAVLLHVARLKEIEGTFIEYDPENQTVQLTDKENNRYFLKVMRDSAIQAEGEPVDIGRVEPNTAAKAVFADDVLKSMEVNVPVETLNNDELAVTILYADPMGNVLKVADEYDNKQYLDMTEDTAVYINGERQGLDAIGFDQDAALKVAGGKVLEVRIFTDLEPEEEDRIETFTGRIRTASGDSIVVSPDEDPEKENSYRMDNMTAVLKKGITTDRSVLRQGDRIKFQVNPVKDNYISRIEVQVQGAMIDKIYKGDIVDVLPATGEVILTKAYNYGYYDWKYAGNYLKYSLSPEAVLYRGNEKLRLDELKNYIGKSIYAVSKDNYGTEELMQISLKEGFEDTTYKTIGSIKWTEKQMTLSNGKLLSYADGTIVVRDGRLLDTNDLDSDMGAFIIQNTTSSGVDNASVVCLESFNAFANYRISKGYINSIGEDYFSLDNSFELTNNNWTNVGDQLFRLSNETLILDGVDGYKTVPPDRFVESRYEPFTYLWPNYKAAGKDEDGKTIEFHEDNEYHSNYKKYKHNRRYHEHYMAYVVYDEDNIARAMVLYEKDKENYNPDRRTDTERMVAGLVDTIEKYDLGLITLKDAREYSLTYSQWRPVRPTMPIDTDEAIIITRDGVTWGTYNLEAGSEAYIMCEDNEAIFVFVE